MWGVKDWCNRAMLKALCIYKVFIMQYVYGVKGLRWLVSDRPVAVC